MQQIVVEWVAFRLAHCNPFQLSIRYRGFSDNPFETNLSDAEIKNTVLSQNPCRNMRSSHVTFSKIFQAFSDTSFEDDGIHVLTKNIEAELFIQSNDEFVSGIKTSPITITEIPTTPESHELGRFQKFLADFISNKVLNMERPYGPDRGRLVKDVCTIGLEGGERSGYPILWIENRSGEGFTIIPSEVPEYK